MKKVTPVVVSIAMLAAMATLLLWTNHPAEVKAHCQVPCGIYDDPARIQQLREDSMTIEKAIHAIGELSGKNDATSINQATRWIMTKEEHASHIIKVVSEYFLTQKVKAAAGAERNAYLDSLADHHAVMVAAMKCKQVPEPASVEALNAAITKLATHYPDKK